MLVVVVLMFVLVVFYYKIWIVNLKVWFIVEQMVVNLCQVQVEVVKCYWCVVFYCSGVIDCISILVYSVIGNYWVIQIMLLVLGELFVLLVQCGMISDGSSNIQISGWIVMCYGINGCFIVIVVVLIGIGVVCFVLIVFDIDVKNSVGISLLVDCFLCVNIVFGGGICMCDLKCFFDFGNLDGC